MTAAASTISPPEPDLTPAEIIARAEAMCRGSSSARPRRRTSLLPAAHPRGVPQGRLLPHPRAATLRRLRVRSTTLWRVVIAIARGCPSTAWCFCLAAGHALQVGSLFEEQAQAELFGDGDFLWPAVAAPAGEATRTEDGWELTGTHPYSSGAPYSTHYMGQTFAARGRQADAHDPALRRSPQRMDDARRLGRHARPEGLARTAFASRAGVFRPATSWRTPGWSTSTCRAEAPATASTATRCMQAGPCVLPGGARRHDGRRRQGCARRVRGDHAHPQDPAPTDHAALRGSRLPTLARTGDRQIATAEAALLQVRRAVAGALRAADRGRESPSRARTTCD